METVADAADGFSCRSLLVDNSGRLTAFLVLELFELLERFLIDFGDAEDAEQVLPVVVEWFISRFCGE